MPAPRRPLMLPAVAAASCYNSTVSHAIEGPLGILSEGVAGLWALGRPRGRSCGQDLFPGRWGRRQGDPRGRNMPL